MRSTRLRGTSLVVLLLLDALVILSWSERWIDARVEGAAVPVAGSVAGGAELPLALTGLALVAALAIAGPVFRVILSVLAALLGLCIAIAGALVLSDPIAASRGEAARVTGVAGDGVRIVAAVTPWPAVATVLGVLLVVTSIAIAATVRLWPRPTSRFRRSRLTGDGSPADPIDEWDALSDGEDPTGAPR